MSRELDIKDLQCCGNCMNGQWKSDGCWCGENSVWVDGNQFCKQYTFDCKSNNDRFDCLGG